jgi:DNA polymerase I
MITFDLETDPTAPGLKAPSIACTAMAVADHPPALFEGLPWDLEIALVPGWGPLVGHNVAYDMACIASARPDLLPDIFRAYRADRVTDTMLRQQLIDTAAGVMPLMRKPKGPGYSLDAQAKRILGTGKEGAEWALSYGALRHTPMATWPEGARTYPLIDVERTRAIYWEQEKYPQWLQDQFRQARAAFALHLTSTWGIVTDPQEVARLRASKEGEIRKLEEVCKARGWVRADGSRDTKKVMAAVEAAYGARGAAVPKTEPSGKYPQGQTKKDALTCLESGDEALTQYGKLGELSSFVDNFLPVLERGLLQSRYDFAESGRSTSSQPNTQNFPVFGGIRECCVPRPGYVYVCADYGKLELCTLAQVCLDLFGRSALADMLNRGIDPHLQIASRLAKISYSEALARKRDLYLERQTGKVGNFGYPGGLGHTRMVQFAKQKYDVIITEGESRTLKALWLSELPEMNDYFAYVSDMVDRKGEIVQLRSNRTRGNVGYTDACNTLFQGLGADIAKSALFDVAEACYAIPSSPLFGCRPVNFIHDEIYAEAPEHRAAAAAVELGRIMVEAARPWLPGVMIEAVPLITRRWSKSAEPTFDRNGELVPWERAA